MTTHSKTEIAHRLPQHVKARRHGFRADLPVGSGGTDSAPSPHDYFDAALATCKALTATAFARTHGIPLERVEVEIDRDDWDERDGEYRLNVRLTFHGPLNDHERARLHAAVGRSPIHKLMTTAAIVIHTEPLPVRPELGEPWAATEDSADTVRSHPFS
jgi:putative redox protein